MKHNRCLHIDFHNLPGIDDLGSKFDLQKFAHMIKTANIECVNIFAQCNIGFSYYPTKVGTVYPSLSYDLFGKTVKVLKQCGISVVAYLNGGLNHELAIKHSEYCRVNEDGQIISGDRTDNFARTMCFNNSLYVKYMLSVIDEILEYDVDGIFLDCVFPVPCYCNHCMADMKMNGVDVTDDEAVKRFSLHTAIKFAETIKNHLPGEKTFYVNGLPFDNMIGINTHIEVECLPEKWGYDFFLPMAAYARSLSDDILYMTGRFMNGWGDFGGYRSLPAIENDAFDAIMNCCGFSVGDHMHPTGALDTNLYNNIKSVFKTVRFYQKYTNGYYVISEVAVLKNTADENYSILDATIQGAARILSELKYCFDIINESADLSKYKLVVLADNVNVDMNLKDKLEKYINSGGAVISTGDSGIDFDINKFVLENEKNYNLIGISKGEDGQAGYYIKSAEDRCVATYTPCVLFEANDKTDVQAYYVEPYFYRHWDGIHGYFYTPPKEKTNFVTAIINKNTARISFPIFRTYFIFAYREHRELLKDLIERILKKPLISDTNLPLSARVTLLASNNVQNSEKMLFVKVTYPERKGMANIVDEHNILAKGHFIKVKGCYGSVIRMSDGATLETISEDDYTKILLPQINGFDGFILKC